MKTAFVMIGLILGAAAWLIGSATEVTTDNLLTEMLHGVEARPIPCPTDVQFLAIAEEMTLICATTDNDFDRFEYLWNLEMIRGASDHSAEARPHMSPITQWELIDGVHERVYRYGEFALGVRVSDGYLMLAYK